MLTHAPEGDDQAWILVTSSDEHVGWNANPIAHCEVELTDGKVRIIDGGLEEAGGHDPAGMDEAYSASLRALQDEQPGTE